MSKYVSFMSLIINYNFLWNRSKGGFLEFHSLSMYKTFVDKSSEFYGNLRSLLVRMVEPDFRPVTPVGSLGTVLYP